MSVSHFSTRFGLAALLLAGILIAAGCGGGTTASTSGKASTTPIKIGLVTSVTGPLAAYGQEEIQGFKLGLEYATHGTNMVAGHPIQLIIADDTGSPAVAKQKALELLTKDHVQILQGTADSSAALAIEPLALQYKTIFVIGPAVADSLTNAQNWNKYIFKVSRNSSMDAQAAVGSITEQGATVAQLAPDYAFGHDSVDAFRKYAVQAGLRDVLDIFAPLNTTDFTPYLQRIIQTHPQYLYVTWAGSGGPWKDIMNMKLMDKGIKIVTGVPNIAAIKALFSGLAGMQGFTDYYYTLPKNPVNDWLVQHNQSEFGTPPDLFTPDGFAAAQVIVKALELTKGNPDGDAMAAVMEDMTIDSPKGPLTLRASDHQALQTMYAVRLEEIPGQDHPVPVLLKELHPVPPVTNGRQSK